MDIVVCPDCNRENVPKKEWYYGPPADPKRMKVQSFRCVCGTSYLAWHSPDHVTVRVVRGVVKKKDRPQRSES